MADMVASALLGETLSRITTGIIDKHNNRSSEQDDMERLEMAHIKMEAALHMSGRWQIVDVPMLRWRRKLKRAAQECDDTLRRCKQRALKDEETRKSTSFAGWIGRSAMSFMASLSTGPNSGSYNTVRRFERFAEGTKDFLKLIEFGGRCYTFFNPLIGNLLMGKTLHYQRMQGGKSCGLIVQPMSFAERGVEAMVTFVCKDMEEPTKIFSLALMMRLSESCDIFGIIIKCLKSIAVVPHFMAAAEDARRELIQLPSQDFSWVEHSQCVDNLINVHGTLTQWFRSDPLCCSDHGSTNYCTSTAASMYPEEVIAVYLRCCISLADEHQSHHSSATENARRSSADSGSAPLKLGIISIPHFSPESTEPDARDHVYEVTDGNGQGIVHGNACLQDVDEQLLAKAIYHLCENSGSSMYLRSKHGSTYLCTEKMTTLVPSRRAESQSHTRNIQVIVKLIEAIRALGRALGKEQMDMAAFGFFSAALELVQHSL